MELRHLRTAWLAGRREGQRIPGIHWLSSCCCSFRDQTCCLLLLASSCKGSGHHIWQLLPGLGRTAQVLQASAENTMTCAALSWALHTSSILLNVYGIQASAEPSGDSVSKH